MSSHQRTLVRTEITPSMIPSVSQYAGQQLLTGQQAEAYADHFIAVHVANMSGGKTYSQLSAASLAQPTNTGRRPPRRRPAICRKSVEGGTNFPVTGQGWPALSIDGAHPVGGIQ